MIPPETEGEQYRRLADETIYRQSITMTHWHRYAILARHTIEGPWFDEIWNSFDTYPSQLHHLIWYNFMYHVDRKNDIPEKLQSWAMSFPAISMDSCAGHSISGYNINILEVYSRKD